MKQINTVALNVLRRRISSPSYYWMIFAPLLLGIFLVLFNHYASTSDNRTPVIAVVGATKVKDELAALNPKTYRLSSQKLSSQQVRADYLQEFKIAGVLRVNDDFSSIIYTYYSAAGGSSLPTELKQDLSVLASQQKAAQYGLTAKQWQALTANIAVTTHDRSPQTINNYEAAENVSELLTIAAFFILTSYIAIVGSEIGKEKGDHVLGGILAAITPQKHFAGKILGVAYLMTFQFAVYAICGVGLHQFFPKSLLANFKLTQLATVNVAYIVFVALLIITSVGLFILATAAFAALVTKNEDISQVTTAMGTLAFVPYMLSFIVQGHPNMWLAKMLAFIPFFNQSILPIRIIQNQTALNYGWIVLGINVVCLLFGYGLAQRIYCRNAFISDERTLGKRLAELVTKKTHI